MMHVAKRATEIWMIGSVITLLVVWWLWEDGDKAEAVAVTILSPFPCPTGLPC